MKVILLFFLLYFSSEQFTDLDFLKTDDTQIKNNYGKGNCVYLRGTNIGIYLYKKIGCLLLMSKTKKPYFQF